MSKPVLQWHWLRPIKLYTSARSARSFNQLPCIAPRDTVSDRQILEPLAARLHTIEGPRLQYSQSLCTTLLPMQTYIHPTYTDSLYLLLHTQPSGQ